MESEIKVNVFAPTKPHATQKVVLDDPARFKLIRCGRKWRKTSLFTSWQMENALLCQKGLTYPLILPFQEQARETVWNDHVQRLLTEFNAKGLPIKINETALSVTFKHNNARFKLFGVNNEIALRSASKWGALALDEFDDFPSDVWSSVLRPNLMTHKAPAMVGGTPKGYRNMYKLENGGLFKAFHYTSHDNPDLDVEELESLVKEYKDKGEDYYRQEIMAEYTRPVGIVYGDWDLERHYVPFDYDPNLPVHLAWDFGINDPTVILFLQPNGHEIRLFDYYEKADANIEHFAQYINSKGYNVPAFEAGDMAGRARDLTSGKSPITELAKNGHFVRTAKIPNIPAQIRNTHKFINRLYVSKSNPACERFVECLLNYRYPKKSDMVIDQSNEIPTHDEYSHALRAFEYYCWNLVEQSTRIEDNPPANSFTSYLRKKEEERLLKREYVGY